MFTTISQQEIRLGDLAIEFRGTRIESDRRAIVEEYEKTVDELILSNLWDEVPPPEDQLPRDRMPEKFFQYWADRYRTS